MTLRPALRLARRLIVLGGGRQVRRTQLSRDVLPRDEVEHAVARDGAERFAGDLATAGLLHPLLVELEIRRRERG